MNIPVLFENTETKFESVGLGFLAETVRCEVHEVLNAEFELELEYPLNGKLAAELVNGRYIYAFVDAQRGYNPFEIDNVDKNMNSDTFTVTASHQTNILRKRQVKEFKVENVSCTTAMNELKKSLLEPTNIEFYSDIDTQNSTLLRFKSALSCIGGVEGSILDTWRGEIERTTGKISMLKRRGADRGLRVAFGKNMMGLTVKVDTLDTINAILPYAIKTESDSEMVISLSENYIYAPNYKDGDVINAAEVDYSSDETVQDETSLRTASKNYFSSSTAHEPSLEIEISFQDLGETEEYKTFRNMNQIYIGDTITAYHKDMDVDFTARMVEFKIDSLTGEYIECVLGSVKADFKSTITSGLVTKDEVDAGDNRLQQYVDDLTDQITGNQGGNLIVRPKEKPAELLIMDTESIDTAVNLWRFNQKGLGHSSSGYNGEYTIGLTQDGKIVADLIAVGTLKSIDVEGVNITGSKGFFDVLESTYLPPAPAPQYEEKIRIGGGEGFSLSATRTTKSHPALRVRLNSSGDLGLAIEAINESTGEVDVDKVVRLSPFAGIETPFIQSYGWCSIGADADGKTASIDRTTWNTSSLKYVPHRALSYETASSERYKSNIHLFKKKAFGKTAKDVIDETHVYTYIVENDDKQELRTGFIAEQAADEITAEDNKAIDLYKAVAWLYQHAKEQNEEIERLKNELEGVKANAAKNH